MELTINITALPYIIIQLTFPRFIKGTPIHAARWRPGRYEAANYTKYIRHVQCADASGNTVPLEKSNFFTWIPKITTDTDLVFTYEYYANQLDAGSTYVDTDICYLNFLNFVLFAPTHLSDPINVRINLPDNFNAATSLLETEKGWVAKNFYELADSPLLSSPNLAHLTYKSQGIPFHIWLHNLEGRKQLLEDFKKFTDQQIDDMGFFPYDEYHFLIITYPKRLYHGVEHGKSTVICLGPSEEVLNEKYDDLLGISSHELFHAWNIIHIRPREFVPYNFLEVVTINTGFVAEGFTTYLGDLFLIRSGVKDLEWYLNELSILLRRHLENFGRLHTSLDHSSRDLWADGYQLAGPERKGSIYVEGAIFALMLDLTIRSETHNASSLLQVVREMSNQFSDHGYSAADIQRLSEAACTRDLTEFFDSYLYSAPDTRPLLTELLGKFGLFIREKPNPKDIERKYGIRLRENGSKWTIVKIHPNSAAWYQLRAGDKLSLIDGAEVNSDEVPLPSSILKIEVNRHGRPLPVELSQGPDEYFPVLEVYTNSMTSLTNDWLNLG